MAIMLFILLIVVALLVINRPRIKTGEKATPSQYAYTRKLYIMTKAEAACFRKLQEISGTKYYAFPQVHLSSLLDHAVKGQNWKGALAKIQRKSVDFAIVDSETLQTLLVIELDDYSHERVDRKIRDKFVDEILSAAKIPLIRLNSQSLESLNEGHITQYLAQSHQVS